MSNIDKIIKAAEKAVSWSRFVTLLMFGLLLVGLHSARDWSALSLLLVGVTTFIALAFGVELLHRRFFGRKG